MQLMHEYHPLSSTQRGIFVQQLVHHDPLPSNACYATTKHDIWNCSALMGYSPTNFPVVSPPLTISDQIASNEANWILNLSNIEGNSAKLATAISEGRGLVVADGLYMAKGSSELRTTTWKLEDVLTR
jgi:hypothetical protein